MSNNCNFAILFPLYKSFTATGKIMPLKFKTNFQMQTLSRLKKFFSALHQQITCQNFEKNFLPFPQNPTFSK